MSYASLSRGYGFGDTSVSASMSPYAPFAKGSGGGPSGSGAEVQVATSIMSDLVNGVPIDVNRLAEGAGAIVGGAAGAPYGPVGIALGTLVGGTVGKAIGGLVGAASDCGTECQRNYEVNQLRPRLCISRSGNPDPKCWEDVYGASSGKFGCVSAAITDPIGAIACQRAFTMQLATIVARLKLQDDIAWATRLIVLANKTAAEWGPKCAPGDSVCVNQVKAAAIQYGFNFYPFRQEDARVTEDAAFREMQAAMNAAVGQSSHTQKVDSGAAAATRAASAQVTQSVAASMAAAQKKKKYIIIGAASVAVLAVAAVLLID